MLTVLVLATVQLGYAAMLRTRRRAGDGRQADSLAPARATAAEIGMVTGPTGR